MPYLYESPAPIGLQSVKARPDTRAGRDIAAHASAVAAMTAAQATFDAMTDETPKGARAKAESGLAAARIALVKAATRAKSAYKFLPAEGVKIARYNISDETFTAWLAAEDAEARAAVLAGSKVEPTYTESPVHPSITAHAGYRALLIERARMTGEKPSAFALAELASGILVLPSTGRGASAKADRKSAEERAAEAAEAMFADADADAESDTE